MRPLPPLRGLVAAAFTPMGPDGEVRLDAVPALVEHLVREGLSGLYVLGSTGEGPSLTAQERRAVADAFVRAAAGRLPVLVQVGCESLAEARGLAAHAQRAGADAVSAVSPVYFKPASADALVDSMAEIAAGAPDLPFFYYHIPAATGVATDAPTFLSLALERIPTFRGIKFTSPDVDAFRTCVARAGDRAEILWGLDEMLLSGLAAGARAAVGSTYNFAAPLYRRLLAAHAAGDLEEARRQQARAQGLVAAFAPHGPRAAQKAIMGLIGLDCGPPRLPLAPLAPPQIEALRRDLEEIGFFAWLDRPLSPSSC